MTLFPHGLVRAAAATPRLRVADCDFNAGRTAALMKRADADGVQLLAFPELGLTGYTCGDLFHSHTLLRAGEDALVSLRGVFAGVAVVGLPVAAGGLVFNAAAVLAGGRVLGVVPKTHLPNYKEFYDGRYFAAAGHARSGTVRLGGEDVPFGTDLLFACGDLVLGVEVCEDLWAPEPPSAKLALAGATVVANLSASDELVGKADYRRSLVAGLSARGLCGYVYAGAGTGESSTDLVFAGHSLIAEAGSTLAESGRFSREDSLLVADVDLRRLLHDRGQLTPFREQRRGEYRRVEFTLPGPTRADLRRRVDGRPFVPRDDHRLRGRCEDVFAIQTAGLAKRLGHVDPPRPALGVSGGLDSTLALLVACRALDELGWPRGRLHALTMPGFGTTGRTLANARSLMRHLGVTAREVDIRGVCLEEMRALGHRPFGIALDGLGVESLTAELRRLPAGAADVTFENIQARARTSLLMNTGFVVGTGDLSELALGWCTYNADHVSMYNPNVGVPKTLVKFLIEWAAGAAFSGDVSATLRDIAATEISPELLPAAADGGIAQRTEDVIGPYELHDFFLYEFLRHGSGVAKIEFLARHAEFSRPYSDEEIRRWLAVFVRRFFASQYKRSCLPDGPKVGTVSLSPRGDWRMPSDAEAAAWLGET